MLRQEGTRGARTQSSDTWEGWGIVVLLNRPFFDGDKVLDGHKVDPEKIEFREVNDPHCWKGSVSVPNAGTYLGLPLLKVGTIYFAGTPLGLAKW